MEWLEDFLGKEKLKLQVLDSSKTYLKANSNIIYDEAEVAKC